MNIEVMKIVRDNLKMGHVLTFAEVIIIQQAIDAAMLQGAEPVQANTLPDGWVAVPIEPTAEMILSAMQDNQTGEVSEIYQLMLAAAPQQEADNG